ncbi:MAG: membrane protein insertase YidC [Candidatus Berkelbacteria bacterium]|nr:MAG: membrane protein insertase YidC [Candidatus Berkelbacteria bacterium]QQG51715.1 MAG: membrane protein insertase YidC [Candidatus Berkelbacteria bacterium]
MKEFLKVILYKPLFNLLVFFAWLVPGHSIGWGIILLTVFVKVLLWKLQNKSLRAPLQMRAYQDELKAVQEKHKDDRAAQGQAVLAFYKEKGINPLSGCLPLLIQLPIILILYRVFIAGLNASRPDLIYSFTPHIETINTMFFGIDLAKPEGWILPIIAGVAQLLQSRHYAQLTQSPTGSANDAAAMMNKQMVYLFPIMTFFIARSLPAGLAVYWIASTLFQFVQQYYVFKTFKLPEAKVKLTVREKK